MKLSCKALLCATHARTVGEWCTLLLMLDMTTLHNIIGKKEECPLCWGLGSWHGVAPHTHDMQATGSIIGSTKILPKDQWPSNYIPDGEDPSCGTYLCPRCSPYIDNPSL